MLKRRNIEACLGVGRVRAKTNSESVTEPFVKMTEHIQKEEAENHDNIEIFTATNEAPEEVLKHETIQPDPFQLVMAQLEKQIASLEKQLEVKDLQLASKDDIIKNFQVLLKSEQDNVLKLTTNAVFAHTPSDVENPDANQTEQSAWWKKWLK